jgi:hypothetical protein
MYKLDLAKNGARPQTVTSNPHTDLKDTKYSIGLTLVIVSSLACVISYYLIFFAAPVFIIGSILIFFSKKSWTTKIVSALLPLVLYVPLTIAFLYLYNWPSPKTFLIPFNYSGTVRVVYGEPCGVKTTKSDGRTEIIIPPNGFVILQDEPDSGIIDYEYYYLDNGRRIKINSLDRYDTIATKSKLGVFLGGSGSFAGDMPDGSSSSESPLAIHYSDIFVNRPGQTEDFYRKDEKRIDSLTQSLVLRCRAETKGAAGNSGQLRQADENSH